MGQYFRPLLIHEDGEVITASSHDFDNGIKLMEHSWIGNNFVNAILFRIKDNPTRVAWIGDYADGFVGEKCNFGDGFITSENEFMASYNDAWDSENGVEDLPQDSQIIDLNLDNADGYYLVNLTKKCYVDMGEYVRQNSIPNRFGDSQTWCINPLPILTCVGNGMGGGDYYGETGKDDVGSWAFDQIYITYLRPGKMNEVMYLFQEK